MDVIKLIMPKEGSGPMAQPTLDVSGVIRKFIDIPYASQSPRQKLDIYLPDEGDGPFPTIVFIHGGAFVGGDKLDTQVMYVIDGIRRGYAVVSVEQRLLPDIFPEPLFDFKAAIRFLRANAGQYCLDPERFAACGDSAGGYFAVMTAATNGIPAYEDLTMGNAGFGSEVQAVITWFGVHNLVMQSEFSNEHPMSEGMPVFDFADMFAGLKTREHRGLMRFTNPVNFIKKDFPPILIQAGDKDQVVPFENSVELAEKVKEICGGDRVEFDVFEGCLHGDPKFSTKENQERIFGFLDKHLK